MYKFITLIPKSFKIIYINLVCRKKIKSQKITCIKHFFKSIAYRMLLSLYYLITFYLIFKKIYIYLPLLRLLYFIILLLQLKFIFFYRCYRWYCLFTILLTFNFNNYIFVNKLTYRQKAGYVQTRSCNWATKYLYKN